MGLLEDKVVVVTGAGRGIGRGEAVECARQGAAVIVAEFDADAGDEVAAEITAAGGRAVAVPGDVSDADVADRLVSTAVETWGALDAVVNNAGILRDRTLVKMSDAEWDDVIRVHLRGHFAPTRAACQYWRENQRPGHLVHTASTSGSSATSASPTTARRRPASRRSRRSPRWRWPATTSRPTRSRPRRSRA